MRALIDGERTLTISDFLRLSRLFGGDLPADLANLLSASEVLASRDVPSKTVTMYSRVELVDAYTLRRQQLTLCYPCDAEPAAGFISVLSPVGCALLGRREGETVRWLAPSGEECAAQLAALVYQPEACGDYTP